jgi:hypothetical protein
MKYDGSILSEYRTYVSGMTQVLLTKMIFDRPVNCEKRLAQRVLAHFGSFWLILKLLESDESAHQT